MRCVLAAWSCIAAASRLHTQPPRNFLLQSRAQRLPQLVPARCRYPRIMSDAVAPPTSASPALPPSTSSDAAVVKMEDAPAPTPSPTSAPAPSFARYSCKLIGLDGWDSAIKVERRLLASGVAFAGVMKRKGVRETEAQVFFDSEEQMREQVARMANMREELKAGANKKRSAESAGLGEAGAESDAAAAGASDAAAAAAPAAKPAPQGRLLWKVRDASVSQHDEPYTRPAESATPGAASFRGARVDLDAQPRERSNKRLKTEGGAAAGASKSTADGAPAHVNDIVAPLWRLPYVEQLRVKREGVAKLMQTATRRWRQEYRKTLTSLKHACVDTEHAYVKNELFCPLAPIVASPVTEGYRNKCEFSIGYDSAQRPTTGFLMGSFTAGVTRVEAVADVPHVPAVAKALVEVFDELLRSACAADPGLCPYDKREHAGFFRLLSVRNAHSTRQAMLLLQVDPKARSAEQMDAFRAQLLAHFRARCIDDPAWSAAHEGYTLQAVQLQLFSGVSNVAPEDTPVELLYGERACITERLMGLDFRVSQPAFFQINVAQTEKLYSLAADCAQLPAADAPQSEKDRHLLLDVCCGTGTIGLALAARVGKVVGLEMNEAATEDAKFNAKANGIKHAHYYVGRAEDTIRTALDDHVPTSSAPGASAAAAASSSSSALQVTAIVDPPRMGLHSDVLRLLRRCQRIDRIVYVSCNPASLMDNLTRFVQPPSKQYTGAAFTPVKAIPVDMFPHTDHCEMIVLLEREPHKPEQTKNRHQQQPTKQFAHQMGAAAAAAASTSAQAPTVSSAEGAVKEESATPVKQEQAVKEETAAPIKEEPAVKDESAAAMKEEK